MSEEIADEVQILEQEDEDGLQKGSIIWNYFKISGVQSKRAGAKNAACIFCVTDVTGCSTSRAFAHILGRPVGQPGCPGCPARAALLARAAARVGPCCRMTQAS